MIDFYLEENMKNIILILLIISILFSVVSCNNVKEKNTDTIDCEKPYTVTEMNEFLQYISESQKNSTTNVVYPNGASNYYSIPIPKLINEDYKFLYAEDAKNEWVFAFSPNDFDVYEQPSFIGIYVCISKNLNTFDVIVDQFDMTVVDNYAFSEKHNTLLIEINNRRIEIVSQDASVVIDSPEKLNEYFEFEDYTIGDDNSNVAIK